MRPHRVEFEVAPRGDHAPFSIAARRRVTTFEGRLARSPLARAWPTITLFFLLVLGGELATVFQGGRTGVLLHAVTLFLTITHSALVRRANEPLSNLLVALTPVPLIRIVSLTSPLAQFSYVQWFTIIGVVLYAGILTAVKILKPDLASIGLRLPRARDVPLEIAVAVSGIGLGWIEYQILEPGALVTSLTIRQLAGPMLVLFVSTGILEELLFRGLIQRYAGEAIGPLAGIAFATALFGILHTGWFSVLDVVFVSAVGAIYALVVRRTGSILGVSISHGLTNSMLFLVMPLLA